MKISKEKRDNIKLYLLGISIGIVLVMTMKGYLTEGESYYGLMGSVVFIMLLIEAKMEVYDQVQRAMERYIYKHKDS
jgi:hypothetical protein